MSKRKNFSPEIQEKTRSTATAARKIRGRILIVCEGKETEPNYFNSFPKMDNVSVVTAGGKGSPSQVVKKAMELRDKAKQSPYDAVWAVFDKDNFTDFKTAIDTAHKEKIGCAWSNEAFELWFIYHFERLTTFTHRNDYGSKIEAHVQKGAETFKLSKYKKFIYKKNDENVRRTLLNCGGNEEKAIAWAEKQAQEQVQCHGEKWDKHNPCTMVYLLVKQLLGKDEAFNRKISNSL